MVRRLFVLTTALLSRMKSVVSEIRARKTSDSSIREDRVFLCHSELMENNGRQR